MKDSENLIEVEAREKLKAKAQWVADLLKADRVTPEQLTPDLVEAYFDEVGRRIKKIQGIYLTRPGARSVFAAKVLSDLHVCQ